MRDDAMRCNVPQAPQVRVVQTHGTMKARSLSQAYRHRRIPFRAVHFAVHVAVHSAVPQ
ncbi:protein of unknown function [Paraburkholderia dioscoreae]|uniref:Uncharacterized protein n=1 Tax=Paraburkholderia dioscoreae TaxID=2604047 RepID=A0A5Q4ZB85_9BURK|nr:protein of unknown function [Paraburkholderia dioscoreae]